MNTTVFTCRPSTGGPVFVGSYAHGENVEPWEPDVGNMIAARTGTVTVQARITSAIDRKYEAEVTGFENWHEYAYKNLKPGDQINLTYEQLFGCSR
ncbi:MAG: hypothetical protein KKG12_01220 [Gammaproteobacteria bacterium]|nr:hypothetical protein [Gammaproteobacteria bacterium]